MKICTYVDDVMRRLCELLQVEIPEYISPTPRLHSVHTLKSDPKLNVVIKHQDDVKISNQDDTKTADTKLAINNDVKPANIGLVNCKNEGKLYDGNVAEKCDIKLWPDSQDIKVTTEVIVKQSVVATANSLSLDSCAASSVDSSNGLSDHVTNGDVDHMVEDVSHHVTTDKHHVTAGGDHMISGSVHRAGESLQKDDIVSVNPGGGALLKRASEANATDDYCRTKLIKSGIS